MVSYLLFQNVHPPLLTAGFGRSSRTFGMSRSSFYDDSDVTCCQCPWSSENGDMCDIKSYGYIEKPTGHQSIGSIAGFFPLKNGAPRYGWC